jgi:multicomponent Na+:H+ antiporter subunit D
LLEEAGAEVGYGWVAVVALVATALTSGALLRAAARIFLGRGIKPEAEEGEIEESEVPAARGYTPAVMLVSATVLIVAGLVLGAIPGLVDRAQEAAAQFTDRGLYDAAVLDRPLPAPAPEGHLHIGALEVLLSLLSVVGSFAVAAAVLRRKRPFAYPEGRLNPLGAALLRLRRLHSGQIGDYVAWGVLGFAALGGSLALAVSP